MCRLFALGNAEGTFQQVIGFLAVMAAAGNAVGGYVVTDRMLAMFQTSKEQALDEKTQDKNTEADA